MQLQQRPENYLERGWRRFSFLPVIFQFHTGGNRTWSDTTHVSHKKCVAEKEICPSMDAFLLKLKNDCKTVKVTATEIANIYYIVIVQDSQSHRWADCGSKLAPLIFPDLEIAKKKMSRGLKNRYKYACTCFCGEFFDRLKNTNGSAPQWQKHTHAFCFNGFRCFLSWE